MEKRQGKSLKRMLGLTLALLMVVTLAPTKLSTVSASGYGDPFTEVSADTINNLEVFTTSGITKDGNVLRIGENATIQSEDKMIYAVEIYFDRSSTLNNQTVTGDDRYTLMKGLLVNGENSKYDPEDDFYTSASHYKATWEFDDSNLPSSLSLTIKAGSGVVPAITGIYIFYYDDVTATAYRILDIGEVEYTDACKAKIDTARASYEALSAEGKEEMQNDYAEYYKMLTDAEAKWASLRKAAVVKDTNTKISAIGTVAYTDACKAKIDAARSAYDALSAAEKAEISDKQLKVLTDAEKAYAKLEAAATASGKTSATSTTTSGNTSAASTTATTSPKTGETTNGLVVLLLAMVSVSGLVVTRRKEQ